MSTPARKGSRSSNKRAAKGRKKKFQGNRYTVEADTEYVSASAKKLKSASYEDIRVNFGSSYIICHFASIFNILSECLVCKSCGGEVQFDRSFGPGIAFKLVVQCSCNTQYIPSSPTVAHASEVNRRFMFAMRMLGGGQQSLKTFCGLMDMTCSFSNNIYYSFLHNLQTAAKAVFQIIQTKAVREEIQLNTENGNEPLHLSVSGDGSWKKRGYQSLFGVVTLIGKYTGKILDTVVKSSYCQNCANWSSKKNTPEYEEWMESHIETCSVNHAGSSGKMEPDAMLEMFSRSEELLGVKYANYIGDGDSTTFKKLLDANPYNDNPHLKKRECVGHVAKRMGSRLRTAKKGHKGIGGKGKGKLTMKMIADLQIYYGLAIRRNTDSVQKMRDAIWSTFYHKCSTDSNPQHSLCPEGADSWCKWRVAEAKNELASFKHENPLLMTVQKIIKPIYESLTQDDLLERCLGGHTQNCNESFNACVWRLAPKHLHCASETISVATYIAASMFNEGYSSLLKIMAALGISVGIEAKKFADDSDAKRIKSAESRLSSEARAAIINKRREATATQDKFEREEDLCYGPGIAD